MTKVITGLLWVRKYFTVRPCAGLLFIYILFQSFGITAQQNKPVTYLGLEQGLSNNGVTDIYQDRNGFMWFTTYEGLNKYDGYDFKVFKNKIGDTTSLVGNLMHTINGDNAGRIWIGGQRGASLLYPSTSTFSSLYYKTVNGVVRLVSDEVHIIKSAGKHGMLMGTVQTGLLLFAANSNTGKQITFGKDTVYDVPAVYYDSLRQQAHVFVRNVGLCTFSFQTQKLHIINTQFSGQINFLRADNQGRLWMGNEQGLYLYDFTTNTFSANIMPLECIVADLDEDKEGNLWVGSNGEGIWEISAGTTTPKLAVSVDGIFPLNSNAVATLYIDADGRKWIGTMRGGINRIEAEPLPFKKMVYDVTGKNASLANFINAFCEDNQGNIWIGTSGAGLRYWNRQTGVVKEFVHENNKPQSLSSSFATGIIQDANEDIWVSTWHGSVNRYNKATQSFEEFPCYNPVKKQEERNIWFLFEDSQKRLWASATNNNGSLYLFNRTANRFEPFDNNITNIQVMVEDKQGRLWAGNYSSLILIDPIQKKHFFYNLNNTIRSIHEGKDGSFWVGTQGGGLLLFNRSTTKYQQFTTNDGLPGNSVLRILEDQAGNLWFSSFNGLTRFSPKDTRVTNFSTSDGLQSTQFSFNAGLQLRSGEMLFGGIKGFNIFYPDSVQTKSWMPHLQLTGIRIGNQPLQENLEYLTEKDAYSIKQITLPYDKAAIAVDFAALEFSAPDKIQYSYFLDGWDNDWNSSDNNRTASYTRLTEGHYILRIKNTDAKGEWNKQEMLLKITVLPPWYRSWWAYTLYILAGFAALWLYLWYKRKQTLLEYEVRLAHLDAEKEKELNEKKLGFFTNISHEFRTPLTLIIGPVKDLLYQKNSQTDTSGLTTVYRNARRLLSLVDQLLLFRKADTDMERLRVSRTDFSTLCHEVFLCFIQQAKSKNIEYEFVKPAGPLEIYLDREKIEIALFNLISNAMKYTQDGGRVKVELHETKNGVRVNVADNGPGIPAEAGPRLFDKFYQVKETPGKTGFGIGLFVAKTFVETHKGRLSYKSPKEGKGTIFTLDLLEGRNHFDTTTIFEDSSGGSAFLEELMEEPVEIPMLPASLPNDKVETAMNSLATEERTLLLVDDNDQIRQYVAQIFAPNFKVLQADSGEEGLKMARQHLPELIISDVVMEEMSGIELCNQIKEDSATSHIPVILLTASSAADIKLKGIECGADDYITKPFEKEQLVARVENLLKSRNALQKYFFNEITLQKNSLKISEEYKQFLERCMAIVEENIDRDDFSIKTLASEIGMSHSNLYKKIKSISGQSANAFIRFIRLRKAAQILIDTNCNVSEAAFQVGFNDTRYFRDQFNQLFGINPSDYIKKYRKPFQKKYTVNENVLKQENFTDENREA